MKINLDKTLEQIEKDYWPELNYDSHLERTCHMLRKKPVKDFEIEDFRILIGQNISLKILVPLALEKLSQNIFLEGDLYEGDLLTSVLTIEPQYWIDHNIYWQLLNKTVEANKKLLNEFETSWEIKKNWNDKYELVKSIHETNT